MWVALLQEIGVDEVSVRDQRYDAVYHLVTAADGAEPFYSLANNKGRSESLNAAKEVRFDSITFSSLLYSY